MNILESGKLKTTEANNSCRDKNHKSNWRERSKSQLLSAYDERLSCTPLWALSNFP